MNRLLFFVIVFLSFATAARGQSAGQVGISFDAQLIPQVGAAWHITDLLTLRGSAFFTGGGDEVIDFDRSIGSVALLFDLSADSELTTYIGPDYTRDTFENEHYLGAIVGSRFQLHERFAVFGEFGVSIDVGDSIETVSMFNTGVGVIAYLN